MWCGTRGLPAHKAELAARLFKSIGDEIFVEVKGGGGEMWGGDVGGRGGNKRGEGATGGEKGARKREGGGRGTGGMGGSGRTDGREGGREGRD